MSSTDLYLLAQHISEWILNALREKTMCPVSRRDPLGSTAWPEICAQASSSHTGLAHRVLTVNPTLLPGGLIGCLILSRTTELKNSSPTIQAKFSFKTDVVLLSQILIKWGWSYGKPIRDENKTYISLKWGDRNKEDKSHTSHML